MNIQNDINALTQIIKEEIQDLAISGSIIKKTFNAVRRGKNAVSVSRDLAKKLGISSQLDTSPLRALDQILDAADTQGFDTQNLRLLVPHIVAVAKLAQGEKHNPAAVVRIAHEYLKNKNL